MGAGTAYTVWGKQVKARSEEKGKANPGGGPSPKSGAKGVLLDGSKKSRNSAQVQEREAGAHDPALGDQQA